MRKVILVLVLLAGNRLMAKEIVIRAARVIDGRGAVFNDAAVVVDGPNIVRIEKSPKLPTTT